MCKKTKDHRICDNCAQWDLAHKVLVPVWLNPDATDPAYFREMAPCKATAILHDDLDAGDCYPLLGQYGHCIQHEQRFEPSEDFLAKYRDQENLEAERVFAQPYEIPPRQPDYLEAI